MESESEWGTWQRYCVSGTSWTIVLPAPLYFCPIRNRYEVLATLIDQIGINCAVHTNVSATDSRVITVHSSTGLVLSGTVSVRYRKSPSTSLRLAPKPVDRNASYAALPTVRSA